MSRHKYQSFRAAPVSAAPASEEPVKLEFDSVLLDEPITRLSSDKGLASTDTAFFSVAMGCSIVLDTSTQLLTISRGTEAVCVPLSHVKRLRPMGAATERPFR